MTYRDRMAYLWRANPYRVDRSGYPDRAELDRDNYHDRRPS